MVRAAALAAALLVSAPSGAQDSFGGRGSAPVQRPVTPAQQPAQPAQPPAAPAEQQVSDPAEAWELQDFGVPPQQHLHTGAMHGPTPTQIPGGLVVTTRARVALLQNPGSQALLFDVLGSGESLPNALQAAWLAQPGHFGDQVQQQFVQALDAQLGGRKDTPLVFYCASTQCWMSYNAALRAISAGYSEVLWYRGGLEAWKAAGLPTVPAGR